MAIFKALDFLEEVVIAVTDRRISLRAGNSILLLYLAMQ